METELTESRTTEVYVLGRWIQSYIPNWLGGGEPWYVKDGAPWLWLDHSNPHTTYQSAKDWADERNKDVSLTSPFDVYHIRTATTVLKVVE